MSQLSQCITLREIAELTSEEVSSVEKNAVSQEAPGFVLVRINPLTDP